MADKIVNGMTPAENARAVIAMVREEDLEDLQALHNRLQELIDEAHKDGRLYIAGQYVQLQAGLSAEIKRIRARFQRDTIATNRRELKRLKLEAKAAAQQNGA